MKARVVLIMIALVVAPTAMLGILAASAVRAREADLQARLKVAADQAVKSVAATVEAELDAVQTDLNSTIRYLMKEGKSDGILPAAFRLNQTYDIVGQVCVVHLPDMFLYPAEPAPAQIPRLTAKTYSPGAGPLDRADSLFAASQYEAAAKEYQRVSTQPGDASADVRTRASMSAARSFARLGRFEFAASLLREIAGYSPGEMDARRMMEGSEEMTRDYGGYLHALTALKQLSETYWEAAEQRPAAERSRWSVLAAETEVELLDHIVFLYRHILPDQRKELMVSLKAPTSDYAAMTAGDSSARLASRASYLFSLLAEHVRNRGFDDKTRKDIVSALSRAVEETRTKGGAFKLNAGGAMWVFSPVSEDGKTVAGFSLSPGALSQHVRGAALVGASQNGVRISIEGLDGAKPDLDPAPARVLASGRLAWPADGVKLTAYAVDSAVLKSNAVLRTRLKEWGVFMLAAGILIGSFIVLGQAILEVRRARARSDILAGTSHDLRTPLSSMRMLGESLYLDRVTEPAKQKRFLQTIVDESKRLEQMVERILFFVKLGENALLYQMRKTDVGALVIKTVEPMASLSSIPVRVKVADDLRAARVDPDAVAQLIINLVDNAMKYTRAGLTETRSAEDTAIDVEVRNDGDSDIAMTVKDRGPGISKRDQKRIFKRYYRGEAVREGVSGTGLGLALCKHIVKAHNGRIWVESEPGKGSVFHVRLPLEGRGVSE